jgi:hypothetical protein
MEFDLGGSVRLVLEDADEALTRAVTAQLDPFHATETAGSGPSVRLEVIERPPDMAELQRLAGDGLVTGWDGSRLWTLAGGRWASIPDAFRDDPSTFRVEHGFPVSRLFRSAVRTALQLRALSKSTVAIHAAAVDTDRGAVLVSGWSESGKTETCLALLESGATFLTDKWTFMTADLRASAFPINVGVRRWALRYLPRLRANLPTRVRGQLAAAAATAAVTSPLRRLRGSGMRSRLADGATRAVALADRAAISPTEVARAYGHEPITNQRPVRLIVALRTTPHERVEAREVDGSALATRLAHSAVAERQVYWAYRERAAYAAGRDTSDVVEVLADESELLKAILSSLPHVEVSAPFPVDPNRVVDAIQPWLTEA